MRIKKWFLVAASVALAIVLTGCPTPLRPPPTEWVTIFDLSAWLADQDLGPIDDDAGDFDGTPFAGAGASFAVVSHGGGRALQFTTGPDAWRGLRLEYEFIEFMAGDEISFAVTASVGEIQPHFSIDIDGWNLLENWNAVLQQGQSITNTLTVGPSDVVSIRNNTAFDNPPHLQLRTNRPYSVMLVTELVISGNRLPGWDPGGGEATPPTPPPPPGGCDCGPATPACPCGDPADPITVSVVENMVTIRAAFEDDEEWLADGGFRLAATGTGAGVVEFNLLRDDDVFPDNWEDFEYATLVFSDVESNDDGPVWLTFASGFGGGQARQFHSQVVDGPVSLPVSELQTSGGGGGTRGIVILSNQAHGSPPDDRSTDFSFVLSAIVFHDGDFDCCADGVPWADVISSPYINARSATLTATADGILVSGRGTGAHSHNNGMAFDLVGLRALSDGPGVVVFTGTAEAPIIRKDTQGLAPNTNGAVVDGAFTVTIPAATAVHADVVDGQMWGGPAPLLGSNDLEGGDVPNYTVTGITVDGICIRVLLAD